MSVEEDGWKEAQELLVASERPVSGRYVEGYCNRDWIDSMEVA